MNVLVIGGGLAARAFVNSLPPDVSCTVLLKNTRCSGNSRLAQGGIAVPLHPDDSVEKHWLDTMNCGAWQNDGERVWKMIETGLSLLKERKHLFDEKPDGSLAFGREGAHSLPRIVHAGGDRTGSYLMAAEDFTLEKSTRVLEHAEAEDLLIENGRCTGAVFRSRGKRYEIRADAVVLATGGTGSLFPYTSNFPGSTGDGQAMAVRAGMKLQDMEYIQFHPTLWVENGQTVQLISEALRGAGAVLRRADGSRLMKGVPGGDLAARDVTARAVDEERQKGQPVYLDIRSVTQIEKRFPFLYAEIQRRSSGPLLPVAAGAHFHMGGIPASLEGATAVPGLFAVGETACTGVHGANRLASNSLLEAIVTGTLCAESIAENASCGLGGITELPPPIRTESPDLPGLRRRIHEGLGVVRSNEQLDRLIEFLDSCPRSLEKTTALAAANMIQTAYITAIAAKNNNVPLGAHWKENTHEPTAAETTADPVF
ncbi:MAG: FAD-binding protein [Alkalicoccus sp.]|nr:MAG: FAD-binding protein [Alkalicoccus sp.]